MRRLRAACACTSTVMLRGGDVVCATCAAPVLADLVGDAQVYSTASPDAWPPGCRSRRQARERIRTVPGHVREGSGRATQWCVDVESYRAHRATRAMASAPPRPPASGIDEVAALALAAAGLRATRAA